MDWPDVDIGSETARNHLRETVKAARDAGSPLLTDIEKAAEACEKAACLQPGSAPQRGKPPADAPHGDAVLKARYYAAVTRDWSLCLGALRHGEPPRDGARQAKA
jgi:hypothetical protein